MENNKSNMNAFVSESHAIETFIKGTNILTPFVKNIFEENENLNIIAFKKDAVLAINEKNNKAHFFYHVSEFTEDGMSFHFNLLSECNDTISVWFNKMIKTLHLKLDTKETEDDYFNTLTPNL